MSTPQKLAVGAAIADGAAASAPPVFRVRSPAINRDATMKRLISGLSAILLVPAGLYLILVNLALGLPATQTYLNAIQPQRFAVG